MAETGRGKVNYFPPKSKTFSFLGKRMITETAKIAN